MGEPSGKNQQRKRILVFSQRFWPESFRVNDLCKGFVEQGHSVDVICGIPNYPFGKFFEGWEKGQRRSEVWEGINIHRVWELPRGDKLWKILLNYVLWPVWCLFHLPFIKGKYDLVFSYQLSPVFMVFPAIVYKLFARLPLFIYILDYWPFSVFAVMDIKGKLMRKLILNISKWHYKKADGLIGAFPGICDRLVSEMGFDPGRILYVPQACEKIHETAAFDSAIREKYADKFCIVFTGSVNPAQSFDVVIPAAKMSYDAGFRDIHWVIVGDGMSRKEIEEMAAKAGLAGNFHFEGQHPVEEMPKYYDIADAFIVALKKSELGDFGIPAKVQSYFAAGKPIIGAMDGDGGKLINDNGAGFCGPADDVNTLHENIIKIFQTPPEDRAKMGARAKEYHFKHFERGEQLRKIIEFISADNSAGKP